MRYQPQLVSQQPVASTKPQLFQSLAQRFSAFANKEQDELDREMQKKAKNKGLIDAQGKTTITLRNGNTIADEAWNEGALSSYQAAVKIDMDDNLTRIANEHPNDPAALGVVAKKYTSGLIEGADDSLKPAIKDLATSSILKYTQKAEANKRTLEREEQANNIEMAFAKATEDAILSAEDGDTDGLLDNLKIADASIDSLLSGGFITNKQADKRRKDLNESTDKAVVMGQFNLARKNGKSDEFLSKFLKSPPKYLDEKQRTSYAALMDSAIARDNRVETRLQADEVKGVAKARAKQASDLAISVSRDEATEVDIEEAYQKGVITAPVRTSLTKELDKLKKKAVKLAGQTGRVAAAINANIPMSSRSADDRKAVEAYYKDMLQGGDPFSDENMNATAELIKSTTIMPQSVQETVQAFSKSGNPEQAMQAAEFLARINEKTPQALSSIPADVKSFSLLVSRHVAAGMDPEQAVELSRLDVYERSPEEKKAFADAFELNSKNYREDNRSFLNGKIDDDFDPELFTSQPSLPLAMESEFNLLVSSYLGTTKDLGAAKDLAYSDLKNVWARTKINGRAEMMKYAPEKIYGENWDIRGQLKDDIKEFSDSENPIIVVDPRTAREEKPSYLVLIPNEVGIPQPLLGEDSLPMRWMPDFETSKEGKSQKKELLNLMESAIQEREQNTESQPETPVQMRNSDGTLRDMKSAL